jgi:phosphatidylglycerol---prolipoprotein diacylglyceryl transferase
MNATYATLLLAAIAVTAICVQVNQRTLAVARLDRLAIALSAFVFGTLFAKLPFAWKAGEFSLLSLLFVDGKTLLYGLVGGYVGVELAKACRGVRTKLGDSFAAPVALGAAIGRISCFYGGCCYGSICQVPWGVHFPRIDADPYVLRHPTQIYEFVFHLGSAILLWKAHHWLTKIKASHELPVSNRYYYLLNGNLIKLYFIAYFVYRFFTEFIRPEPVVALRLTEYQWASLLFAFVFVVLLRSNYHPDKLTSFAASNST